MDRERRRGFVRVGRSLTADSADRADKGRLAEDRSERPRGAPCRFDRWHRFMSRIRSALFECATMDPQRGAEAGAFIGGLGLVSAPSA